jgi:hypothetical protein
MDMRTTSLPGVLMVAPERLMPVVAAPVETASAP